LYFPTFFTPKSPKGDFESRYAIIPPLGGRGQKEHIGKQLLLI